MQCVFIIAVYNNWSYHIRVTFRALEWIKW